MPTHNPELSPTAQPSQATRPPHRRAYHRGGRRPTLGTFGLVVALLALMDAHSASADEEGGGAAESPACVVAELPASALDAAAERLRRPPPPHRPSEAWRLGALLPSRLQLRRNDGVTLGIGEILATSGSASERSSALRSAGWSVTLSWDLDRLWLPTPSPPRPTPLAHADAARRLFEPLAVLRGRHGALRAEARDVDTNDPRCAALRAEADALAWALRATLGLPMAPSAAAAPSAVRGPTPDVRSAGAGRPSPGQRRRGAAP